MAVSIGVATIFYDQSQSQSGPDPCQYQLVAFFFFLSNIVPVVTLTSLINALTVTFCLDKKFSRERERGRERKKIIRRCHGVK